MEYLLQRWQQLLQNKLRIPSLAERTRLFGKQLLIFFQKVQNLGITDELDDHERSKLSIFNQLNFFQCITGVMVPIAALIRTTALPGEGWVIASLPALISILVLVLNANYKYQAALLAYFILYPVFICISYINGMSLGVELSFIMYGILSVFFIQDIGYMLFSISLSMVCYFMLSVAWKNYPYQLEAINFTAYLLNQLLAIGYIFYGLYLIKKENTNYEYHILSKNRQLHKSNLEIQKQAKQLQRQAEELNQLNSLKNKLFSIISHDLKSPMYALRNLFDNVQKYNLPAKEIKSLIPDIKKDLNYTVGLMENLLQWAKSQMESHTVHPQEVDVKHLIDEVMQLFHLQAENKKIYIDTKANSAVIAWADKDMVNLVLRNLISNAIKFTPEGGCIQVGANELLSFVEIYVQDSGMGITREAMQKINQCDFYTSNGTAHETGTGLGLMLCKEFLTKNGGHMIIESEPGTGSTFSFTLPRPNEV
jgi:signal transduction histidine kinase